MQHVDDPSCASTEDALERESYIFEGHTDPTIPLVELETLLARPPSWRKRRLQISVLLAALVVMLLSFWNALTPRPPGKTATAAPGAPSFLSITSNVNYGTLTINGRQQTASLPMQLILSSTAKLTITLDASPFKPMTCSVPPTDSTPSGAFNPCVLRSYAPPQHRLVVVLSILLSLDALPPPLQHQAIALLSRAPVFQAAITVPSASQVATSMASDGTITSQLMKAPLQGSASIVPSPLTTLQGDPFCDGQFCFAAFSASASRDPLWAVSIPGVLRWQFTRASGTVFSAVVYPVIVDWQIELTYAPATGWQVSQALDPGTSAARQFSSLSCATGAALLQAQVAGLGWTIRPSHQVGTQGCQLVGQEEHVDRAAFVWRFGVLLAAGALAQRVLPTLPLARPADIAAVAG